MTDLSDIFKYCPRCGAQSPDTRLPKQISCNSCGFLYHHNMAASTAAIVECASTSGLKVLLTVRAKDPKAGMLDLPGGFAEYGETIEDALRRELREELNISVADLRYLTSAPNIYTYKDVAYHVMDLFFTCRPANPADLRPGDEIARIELFEPNKIPLDALAFESTKIGLRYYIDHLSDLNSRKNS